MLGLDADRCQLGSVSTWHSLIPAGASETPEDVAVLSSVEVSRMRTLKFEGDRREYAAAHALLRRAVAKALGCNPSAVPIRTNPCPQCGSLHGRPFIEGNPGLGISLSHTRGAVLVGLANGAVGVDIECIPDVNVVDELLGELHPAEQKILTNLSKQDRPATFAQLWVRKEAYLKALGQGLNRELSRDYLGPDSTLLPQGWTVRNLATSAQHRAAVVFPKSLAGN